MKFIAKPVHRHHPVKRWESLPKGKVIERVRRRGQLSCCFEWYLNGVRIDGFTASQLLKDSH